jgi:hypothetical protein
MFKKYFNSSGQPILGHGAFHAYVSVYIKAQHKKFFSEIIMWEFERLSRE